MEHLRLRRHGALLAAFGIGLGRVMRDGWTGAALFLFGAGFALAAIPADFNDQTSLFSVLHVAAILSALGFWALAIFRIVNVVEAPLSTRLAASLALAGFLVITALRALAIIPDPISQRMAFGLVLGWVFLTSLGLIVKRAP